MEPSCYSFDFTYRPEQENASVDALTRVCGLVISTEDLQNIHKELCHPGITRTTQIVRSRSLPDSVEYIKRISNSCRIWAENKPRFYKPSQAKSLMSPNLSKGLTRTLDAHYVRKLKVNTFLQL